MKRKKLVFVLLIGIISNQFISAQESSRAKLDIGLDYASRYVWRGLEFSDSPVLQPNLSLTTGKLSVALWASYETGGQVVGQEFDWCVSYKINDFSIGFIDYAFPVDGTSDGYFEIRNHIGEATFSYDGTEKFPVNAMVGVNVYNDDRNSVYAEIGFPVSVGSSELNVFAAGGNELYTTDNEFKFTNIGFSMAKDLKISETFSVTASASAIFNPDTDDAYLVFILSL